MKTSPTENDTFEKYFTAHLLPLIEANNKTKEKYRNKFWAWFWTVIFLCCTNTLIVFFRTIIYNHPFSVEQIIIVAGGALFIIAYPLYQYHKIKLNDTFAKFFDYYKFLKYKKETAPIEVNNIITPPHEICEKIFDLKGIYNNISMSINDIKLKQSAKKTLTQGLYITLKFTRKFPADFILRERARLHKKDIPQGFISADNLIEIPSSNYFNIFTNDEKQAYLLGFTFFENLLNLKEEFQAKKISFMLNKNTAQIYLDHTQIYFDNSNLWSSFISKEKYIKLYRQIGCILKFAATLETLS